MHAILCVDTCQSLRKNQCRKVCQKYLAPDQLLGRSQRAGMLNQRMDQFQCIQQPINQGSDQDLHPGTAESHSWPTGPEVHRSPAVKDQGICGLIMMLDAMLYTLFPISIEQVPMHPAWRDQKLGKILKKKRAVLSPSHK